MKTVKEPAREIPVRSEVDVLVVGGGPAGIMAAQAAAAEAEANTAEEVTETAVVTDSAAEDEAPAEE